MVPDDLTPENAKSDQEKAFENKILDELKTLDRDVRLLMTDLSKEQIAQLEDVYYLSICWGDFHLTITKPVITEQLPPIIISPVYNSRTRIMEPVYPIFDYGNRFSTSPGDELMEGGRATGKLLRTVEKIIRLAIARAKEGSGTNDYPEIHVAFLGLDIAQRKAYKLCIDAPDNVFVTNFDPGEWGKRFLKSAQELLDRGYLPTPGSK